MYTVEMFEGHDPDRPWVKGRVLTPDEVKERERTVIDHTFVVLDGEGARFYSDSHMFGHGLLPKNCVPCTSSFPTSIAPRPGFETGRLETAADVVRFHESCRRRERLLRTTQELVDYLNSQGFVPRSQFDPR